ncbi:MAG: hypothetical protein J1D77_03130 [Muribaculaceae bacterium]|nr:hypothetical protein [Muribaculaceae bacterium]
MRKSLSLKYSLILFAGILALAASSCKDDFMADTPEGDNDNILVSAKLTAAVNTRNEYIDEGNIASGTYYLYYPRKSSSSNVNHAMVDFGDAEGPTTGFAYFFDTEGKKRDLKWKHVYNEGLSSQTFHLHNIDSTLFTIYHDNHWQHLRFNVKNVVNPYRTSPLDTINATNDLIYGVGKGTRNSGKLEFELNHIMSLLKVNIEVFCANDGFQMNLDNAEVIITDVSTELGVFDMRDPVLFEYNTSTSTTANSGGYNHTPGYYRNIQDVKLVDPENPNAQWATNHPGLVDDEFKDHFTNHVYETMRWIMPPQSIPTNSSSPRAKLIVKVPYEDATGSPGPEKYKVFSGQIPPVMFKIDSDGSYYPSPEVFSFKGGHQINITASINSPETELTFAPVTIEAWASKGSFTVTTKQAGIYNSSDFYNVARLYAAGHIDQLERFGSVDDDLCSLQIWGNITLDLEKIKESMKSSGDVEGGQNFEFCFNGYTVTVSQEGEEDKILEGAVGQEELYNIVTGLDLHNYKAILTPEDFLTLIDFCNAEEPNKEDLKKYGYFNNMDNTFTFDIRTDITLDIKDVYQKISWKVLGYDIIFDEANSSVVTINLTDNAVLTAQSTDVIDKLKQIVVKNPTNTAGFYDNDSFLFMIECYNNYANIYPDLLGIYGTKDAKTGKWTFYDSFNSYPKPAGDYSSTIYIDGDYAFAGMIPGGPNNNPEYGYSAKSNAFLSVSNDYVTYSSGNADYGNWIHLTAADSKTTNLATTISYYNSKNTRYLFNECGYFKDTKWHFPIHPDYTSEEFNTIFGTMQVDYENKKWDYEFTWEGEFIISDAPVEEGSEETETLILDFNSLDDREMFHSIMDGSYWKKFK